MAFLSRSSERVSRDAATGVAAEVFTEPSPAIRRAAHAVPLLLLPSALWRVAMAAGIPLGFVRSSDLHQSNFPSWISLYVLAVSFVAELLGYLTVGLVRPWGEVVPRWIPLLRGRRIPPLAATVPALLGAVLVTVIVTYVAMTWNSAENLAELQDPHSTERLVMTLCFVPLLAWGPLLAVVSVAYYRRRKRRETG